MLRSLTDSYAILPPVGGVEVACENEQEAPTDNAAPSLADAQAVQTMPLNPDAVVLGRNETLPPGELTEDSRYTQASDWSHEGSFFPINYTVDADFAWSLSMMLGPPMTESSTIPGATSSPVGGSPVEAHSAIIGSNDQHSTPTLLEDDLSSEDDDQNEITGQLSDRLGSLLRSADGEWRFYGATSNLHLRDWKDSRGSISKNHLHDKIQALLHQHGIGHTISNELMRHLTDLYFTWQDPSLHVVDRFTFETARAQFLETGEENRFYSELLGNSM